MPTSQSEKEYNKQIFRTRITHSPYIWFKLVKYVSKYKFEPKIPYYSKSALCSHIVESLVKGDFKRLRELHEKFNEI